MKGQTDSLGEIIKWNYDYTLIQIHTPNIKNEKQITLYSTFATDLTPSDMYQASIFHVLLCRAQAEWA